MTTRTIAIAVLAIAAACGPHASVTEDDAPLPPDSAIPSTAELCDGLDNDGDGVVDDGCACSPGQHQSCWPYAPGLDGVGACARGDMACVGDGELDVWGPCDGAIGPGPETCGDGIDSDCDGLDPPCGGPPGGPDAGGGGPPGSVEVPLFFIGDCVTASCPPEAPYPVGCNVLFSPGDARGCVASTPTSSVVYFQAGDECDQGVVGGQLYCAAVPGAPLDASTCPINKPVPIYATAPSGCPAVH